jgi:hypothetical protein
MGMFDKVLDEHSSKRNHNGSSASPEVEAADDFGAFGWLRGVQDRAIMLEIRHKDGRVTAKGYSWLQSADFDPSSGITLNFSGETVTIVGRNLNSESRPNVRLFAGILRHRVPWIQEADGPTAHEAAKDAVVIEEVKVK